MSVLTPRPDPQTPTRLSWTCPGCGGGHAVVRRRSDALAMVEGFLAEGLDGVLLEDEAVALMREQDAAEAMRAEPAWLVQIPVAGRPWWDVRRYRKG